MSIRARRVAGARAVYKLAGGVTLVRHSIRR